MPRKSSSVRKRALVPWYHEPMQRCITITLAHEQCTYSARYVDDTGRILVCKIHAEMMLDVHFRLIKPKRINIRDAGNARILPFRSA